MKEFLPENESELNQVALEHLKKLQKKGEFKDAIGVNGLYGLQLLNWALENGKVVDPDGRIEATAEAMCTWKPKVVADVLENLADGSPQYHLSEEARNDPEELAWKLFDHLRSRYQEGHPEDLIKFV